MHILSDGRSPYLKLCKSPHLSERCTGQLSKEGANSAADCLYPTDFYTALGRYASVWYCRPTRGPRIQVCCQLNPC